MITDYFVDCVAGNVFHTKTDPAIPTAYYLGLSTTAPTESGANVTEPTDSAYARIALTNLTEPSGGVIENANSISFNESTQSWGTITHYVVFDSPTSGQGNLLMYEELETPRNVEPATVMMFKENTLSITVRSAV